MRAHLSFALDYTCAFKFALVIRKFVHTTVPAYLGLTPQGMCDVPI